ncbi:MAG: efflux RND transporter permease subunit [Thiohalobacteraceae bacterium]
MFDWIIGWSLRNRVVILLLYAVLTVAALFALGRMVVDVFPEFAPPQVQIQTEAPGFAARDVELLVTRPLEVTLQGMPNVEQIRSNSSIGLSRITIVFAADTDIFHARVLAQERLQLARASLPGSVRPPELMPVTSAISWLLKFALVDWSGQDRSYELRSLVDWEFRNRLLAQEGVASVVAVGGEVKQYQVQVDPAALMRLGLPFTRVVDAARDANSVAPAAFVFPTPEEEYFVRGEARVHSLADIGRSALGLVQGSPLTIGDVAEVRFGGEIKRGDGQMYGGPAVIGTVSKLWGSDTLATTQRVEETLRDLATTLPEGVELVPNVFRQASFIDRSIDNLEDALLHSSLIVALVLFLFLVRWRPTVISLIAIPTSLMMGILVLSLLDIGLNALTLGGLVFAIGEVVDDAIIDVENILRRLRENQQATAPLPTLEIVFEGSSEIRNSVVFATVIIVLTFLPVFFLSDIEGRVFAPLAIAYLAAVAGSLLVALTLVPVLCSYFFGGRYARERVGLGRFVTWLLGVYRCALAYTMARPRAILGAALGASALGLVLIFTLGRSFLPAFHEGNIVIAMTLMPGTSLEESLRIGRQVESLVGAMPEVAMVAQRAGRSRLDEDAQPVNFSEFDVTLKEDVHDVATAMDTIRGELSGIPGAAINVSQFITHRMQEIMSGVRSQMVAKVYGPDLDVLAHLQQELLAAVQDVAGVVDLQAEPMVMVPGVDLRVDREAAAAYGITPGEVVRQAGGALNGVVVSQVLEGDRAYDLYVRIEASARADLDVLGNLPLQTAAGAVVPLRAVAQVDVVQEPYMINRDGGARRAVVQWNVAGRDLSAVVDDVREQVEQALVLPTGYTLEYGGDWEGQQRALRDLLIAGGIAILLVFAVMLRAFRQLPLVGLILSNLPFALVGGVLALVIAGETLSVSSLVGLIALFGIATRNGILLISRYQWVAARNGDASADAAALAVQGALDRMLPIAMTALTTALAVIPFLVGDPTGKELQRPLAIVLLGGMVSSTLLNLFVLPSGFAWALRRWPNLLRAPAGP